MPRTKIKTLKNISFKHKKVFMRVDFNVPVKDGKILDSQRIDKAMASIQYILDQGGKLVLASHLGRPKGKANKEWSLQPVAEYLTKKYNLEIFFIDEPNSEAPHHLLIGLKKTQVILLENLRFHPGEEACEHSFAKQLAAYTDVYINEGFSIAHRNHASTTLLAEMIPERAIGFQFQKEIFHLDNLRLNKTEKPFFVFLGGSKVTDKIPFLEKFIDQADEFFIGGMMAYTFLQAREAQVGSSYVNQDYIPNIKKFIERLESRNKKLWLPIDHIVAKGDTIKVTEYDNIPKGYQGMDIGPQTQKLFIKQLARSRSVFWNGPMGCFEKKEFSGGTITLANAIAKYKGAYRIVGGGHSASVLRGQEDEINHVSTGGGASLAYIQNETLPALQSITTKF